MNNTELASGLVLKEAIDLITAVQASTAADGAVIEIVVKNGDGAVLADADRLRDAIGDEAYNGICGDAMDALNGLLTSTKSTKQSSFDDLAE